MSKDKYGENLDERLEKLLLQIRRGTYIPKPSRITEIPKPDGGKRPLVISCIEDKIVQEAVRQILERVYEPTFLSCSYGFRPVLNCHEAIIALDKNMMKSSTGGILEVDIRKCFSSIPHSKLFEMLSRKITDKRFLHLIMKLIKAEIITADGAVETPNCGTPQGSILSPCLANVYLHEAIDEWFQKVNAEEFAGQCTIVRYADDMVFTAASIKDAETLRIRLASRLKEYGLELHEGKTQVLLSGRKAALSQASQGRRMPTFSFLGFLHVWGTSVNRRTGERFWRVKRRTCPIRMRAKLASVKEYVKKYRHSLGLLQKIKQLH